MALYKLADLVIELKNEYADTMILEQKKRELATRDTKTDSKTFKNQKNNTR